MRLKKIKDIDIKGKTILFRVAYDIGPVERNGEWTIKDIARIEATLPTLKYLIEQECGIVMLTWVKRPGGKFVEKLSTRPHAQALARLINKPVDHINDCIGKKVEERVKSLNGGELLMLENSRFYPEEEAADQEFAKKLARGFDICVFDAFAQAHRIHASTTGILKELPSVVGFLMEKEMEAFEKIIESPERPLAVILGGAKISDKIDTLRFLLDKSDIVLTGGALVNTLLKARGVPTGASLVESRVVDKKQARMNVLTIAKELLEQSPQVDANLEFPAGVSKKLVMPVDLVAAESAEHSAETEVVIIENGEIKDNWKYLDIGQQTVDLYKKILEKAKTVFWNGPMGYFEIDQFAEGTKKIANAVIGTHAYSVVAGGDTETIIDKYGLQGKFDHISTGGGVSLRLLAGKDLPVVKYLKK